MRVAWLVVLVCSSAQAQSREDVSAAYLAAVKDPFDKAAVRRYLALLPRSADGRIVVEGDLLLTEAQAERHVAVASTLPTAASPDIGLRNVGAALAPSKFAPYEAREFVYTVAAAEFPSADLHQQAVDALGGAASRLLTSCNECGIRFRPDEGEKAGVRVRFFPGPEPFIAGVVPSPDLKVAAELRLTSSFFALPHAKRIAVIEHELAHIAGYRHDQGGPPACYFDGKSFRTLNERGHGFGSFCSSDDPLPSRISILRQGRPELSVLPEAPDAVPPPAGDSLIFRFEGGDVSSNIVNVLAALNEQKALPTTFVEVVPGQTVCTAVDKQFPVRCSVAVLGLISEINDGAEVTPTPVTRTQRLAVPTAAFKPYTFPVVATNTRAEDLRRHWGPWIQTVSKGRKANHSLLTVTGLELRVPVQDTEQAGLIVESIQERGVKNVVIQYIDASSEAKRNSSEDPSTLFKKIVAGLVTENDEEADLATLACKRAGDTRCSCDKTPVVVLDGPATLEHPDFGEAVTSAPPMRSIHFDRSTQHATHMAGIVGARRNGFGFIGLDSSAQLIVARWDPRQPVLARDQVASTLGENATAIFLFASEWELAPGSLDNNKQVKKPELRTANHVLANELDRLDNGLWVVAAGQAEGGGVPQEISAKYPRGPMHLGDLAHVIVVTACEDVDATGTPLATCVGPNTRVAPNANYSAEFVHVAAPGRSVPSIATSNEYAVATGTSQAAAFVAGLASRMMCCNQKWRGTAAIKERLQVTSRPAFIGEDPVRLAAGVVDPDVALLEPSKSWLVMKDGEQHAEIPEVKWCSSQIVLSDPIDPAKTIASIPARELVRVYRIPTGDHKDQYVAFQSVGSGKVKLHGPGSLGAGHLFTSGTHRYTADEINDVIVPRGRGARSCN